MEQSSQVGLTGSLLNSVRHSARFKRILLLEGALLFLVYALILVLQPNDVFWCLDNNVKYLEAVAITEHGLLDPAIDYPGEQLDPEHSFWPLGSHAREKGGRFYGVYPVPFPAISAVFYRLLGFKGLFIVPCLATLVTGLLLGRFLLSVMSSKVAVLAPILIAVGSPLLFYSFVFMEHTATVCLSLLAFILVSREDRSRWQYMLSGLCLAISIWFHQSMYLFSLCLVLACFASDYILQRKINLSIVWLILAFIIALVPLWASDKLITGNWLGWHSPRPEEIGGAGFLDYLRKQLLVINWNLIPFRLGKRGLLSSILLTLPFAVLLVGKALRLPRDILRTANIAAICFVCASFVFLSLTHIKWPHSGLLQTFPLTLFSLCWLLRRQDKALTRPALFGNLLLVIYIGLYFTLVSTWAVGVGYQWAPRYLLPLYPLIILSTLFCSERVLTSVRTWWDSLMLKGLLTALIVVTIAFQAYSLKWLAGVKRDNIRISDVTTSLDSDVVVTNLFWFARGYAPVFLQKKLFVVKSFDQLASFAKSASERGVERFFFVTSPEVFAAVDQTDYSLWADPEEAVTQHGYSVRDVFKIQERELEYFLIERS